MSSPGIEEWILKSPTSWAKLAKKGKGKQTFEQFKKKFFEGAEEENKGYLKDYIKDEQLREIYEKGAGGTEPRKPVGGGGSPKPVKPTKIEVVRKGKTYSRMTSPRWELKTRFVLQLAVKEKPRTKKYEEYVNILVKEGRTRQAVVKKIQRERKQAKR